MIPCVASRRARVLLVLLAACGHEERHEVVAPGAVESKLPPATSPPQYIIADPHPRGGIVVLPLAGGAQGLVVERRRVIVGPGEPRLAEDAPKAPFVGAAKLPARFGAGFVFWTANDVFRAAAFDGTLTPVVRVPDTIESVSFGPKALVVRTKQGERWAVGATKGERLPVAPLGLADVQALEDGRVLGFTDQGSVFTSTDSGAHTSDATSQVKSPPAKVLLRDDELWLVESAGGASRLEPDGRLSWFDKSPVDGPSEIRKRDPRWRGADAPLRAVLKTGAAVEGGRANEGIVVESGDLVRVDTRSGEILSVIAGRLPPDASCEAVPTTGDVLFACTSRAGQGQTFVVSHTLGAESPLIEQTFPPGASFYASDDGGLAYGSPCAGAASASAVCVRLPSGRWEERDVSGLSLDGGAPADVSVARWVPRADGRVVALVVQPTAGIYDPSAPSFTAVRELRDVVDATAAFGHFVTKGGHVHPPRRHGEALVDTSWSFVPGTGGALRGWRRRAESVEIAEDGRVVRSAFSFDVVTAGAYGLGRSPDGRLYQSSDHGLSWTEVATPPSGIEASELVSCTTAGCDLGAFYRLGWSVRPPRPDTPRRVAPNPPSVRRTRGTELACRPAGPVATRAVPRSDVSPEDLGLGATRLPAVERPDTSYVRNVVPRTIPSPVHELASDPGDLTPSLRGVLSGFGTNHDGDTLTVSGPSKNILTLRRALTYAPAFDPAGRTVRAAIDFRDVLAAGRRAGLGNDEIFSDDPTETGTLVPLLSLDPSGASEIAFHNDERGVLAVTRGERTRVAFRVAQSTMALLSGAVLPNDEAVFLEAESTGVEHVFKLAASGATVDLFDVGTSSTETFYPANPDALAVGPKGDLAIVRTPSGSDPPSPLDPALLLVQGAPVVALAPWSEMKWADDPACKAEVGGHRAVLQLAAPWIRLTTPDLRAVDGPSLVRVRWTPRRVCVEGFEVPVTAVTTRLPSAAGSEPPTSFASWLVGRGSTFTRLVIAEGFEWRQPLECTVVSTGP